MVKLSQICHQLSFDVFEVFYKQVSIYFTDVPVWSKLQTGRIPSPPELLQIVDNNLKLMNNMEDFPTFNL